MTIKLTQRDMNIISFIKEYKIANTSTIQRLFFPSLATTEKRLRLLVEHKYLNRYRGNILSEYVYYKGSRPTNIKHSLLISDIYSKLATEYDLIKCRREYEIKYKSNILRADILAIVKLNGRVVPCLIEIELTKAYSNKYTDYMNSGYFLQLFGEKPIIVIISNRIPKSSIPIHWVKLSEI